MTPQFYDHSVRRSLPATWLFFLSLILSTLSPTVSGARIWAKDGFGAWFPEPPVRLDVSTRDTSGYAYQSSKIFDSGGALYAITVVSIPATIQKRKIDSFLSQLNAEFIKSLGANPATAKTKWEKFGDGRHLLTYQFDFNHEEIPLTGHGFWLNDNNRAIRVSVSYTRSLGDQEVREILSFLETFTLLTN